MLCFCSLSNTWHAVRHAVDTVFSKTKVDCLRFLLAVKLIWEFTPLIFKSEDRIFSGHLLSALLH